MYDITGVFALDLRWPLPPGDPVIRQISTLLPEIASTYRSRPSTPLADVRLETPVANPGKVVGAPINYKAHIEEANADTEINTGKVYTSIDQFGLFLKATSSVIGVSDPILRRWDDRRTDHEIELAVIIGREARDVPYENALDHVFGYCAGLDMTVRGSEFPSFRKSVDTYTVLGPHIVTADEIADPNNLELWLTVNGEPRQRSSTNKLIFDVSRLIEYASSFYTLHPGDIIMTGTPDGVGPVLVGDIIEAGVEGLGEMRVEVARWPSTR